MAEHVVVDIPKGYVDDAVSTNSGKKKRKRKTHPKPGDPDYKTPTQLRNARKRRKKKQEKASVTRGQEAQDYNVIAQKVTGGDQGISEINNKDPSLKYLSNPKAAPTVRNAIKFFREKTNAQAGTNHESYFPVTLGPKLGWRTVARLAVQQLSAKGKNKAKLRIGLFVPGSHDLLPVPDCPVHHRRINGMVKVLEGECNSLGIPAYIGDGTKETTSNQFGLRYIAVAIERSTQKQQLVLVWKEESMNKDNQLLDTLVNRLIGLSSDENRKEIWLHSIWVHYNNTWKHANSIFDREGRWETKFVDDGIKKESTVSSDNPLYGSIREVMLTSNKPNMSGKKRKASVESNIHVPLYFPPQVFRQANLDGFAQIIIRIREWLQGEQSSESNTSKVKNTLPQELSVRNEPKRKRRRGRKNKSNEQYQHSSSKTLDNDLTPLGHCLELYGGVGTIGLNLVDLFDSIDSSDENPFNEKCFHATADEIQRDSKQLCPSIRKKITYKSKSASAVVVDDYDSLQKARVVIVDPPRKGLDPPVIDALCSDFEQNINNETEQALIYVSCGFDAFRRDYRTLVEESGKWMLDRAEGHILFPGSDAIETLAFFRRKR